MKKRHLRKGLDISLTTVTFAIALLLFSLDAFETKHIPLIAAGFAVLATNVKILSKYSRIWGFDND